MPPYALPETPLSTIVATGYPCVGKEQEWEQAIGTLIRRSMAFPGYRGSMFIKPEPPETQQYRVITHFDNDQNRQRWFNSTERQACVESLDPFQERPADIQQVNDFGLWLTPPQDARRHPEAPPKYKTFCIVWLALYMTVLPVYAVIRPLLSELFPVLLTNAILTAIGVAMMTWGILPILNRLFHGWLYPKD